MDRINILIIEETISISNRYRSVIEHLPYDFNVGYCKDIHCIEEMIDNDAPIDIMLLNISFFSDKSFYDFIKYAICSDPKYMTVQKIFISGITNSGTILSNMDIKFYDCILKPVYDSALKRSVNRAIQTKIILDENKKLIDQIETMKKTLEYFLNCDGGNDITFDRAMVSDLIAELTENNKIMSKRYKRINDNLQRAIGEIKSEPPENNNHG